MRYNQFSYQAVPLAQAENELISLGFPAREGRSDKALLQAYLTRIFDLDGKDCQLTLRDMVTSKQEDAWTFFTGPAELSADAFDYLALQLLGFVPFVDFNDLTTFRQKLAFPIDFAQEGLVQAFYHLLNTRTVRGNLLVDELVANNLIPADNQHCFFNQKLLATFDTTRLVREVVYVQTPVDSEGKGGQERVKVLIIRPEGATGLPSVMTPSPYHMGTNDPASDAALHDMAGQLAVKTATTLQVTPPDWPTEEAEPVQADQAGPASEHFYDTDTYTLNDYFLARGMANLYVAGIGTAGSQGFMTTGDAKQVASFKAVIDWLNGRALAYNLPEGGHPVLADWANGRVVTTGKSYLGTLSTALATTGVQGLEAIIAESAISSWYDYYRENGLVRSPGGYPGEDLDTLTALTYSRSMVPGDFLRVKDTYDKILSEQRSHLDRATGDYSQFWADRNYRTQADRVSCLAIYTHGLQDWNVTPKQVHDILKALPENLETHAFLHQGEHIYLNNWQSIDFKESMNALLAQRLLEGQASQLSLAPVLWQDNRAAQTWQTLDRFGQDQTSKLDLGSERVTIENRYADADFARYGKNYRTFKDELFAGKISPQAVTIPLKLAGDTLLNGKVRLQLTLTSSAPVGLISAQLLHLGQAKRFRDLTQIVNRHSIDNGRHFKQEHLLELPLVDSQVRVITKGHLNLQNRSGLLQVEDIQPGQAMTLDWELEPTIYGLAADDQLALVLYTTDFEHTIRDNQDYQLTIDLSQSSIQLPHE